MNWLREKNRFLPGLRSWVGFEQRVVYYDRGTRRGAAETELRAAAPLRAERHLQFSYKPLRLMVLAGSVICVLGFVLAARFVIRRLAGVEQAQMGFTTLVTLVLFMGGVQLCQSACWAIPGAYLRRGRPLFIVRRRYPDGSERSGNQAREDRTPE